MTYTTEQQSLIDFLLREHEQKARQQALTDAINVSHAYRLAQTYPPTLLPLYSSKLSAGFESPASDHIEDEIDLAAYLVDKPSAGGLWRITGDSMDMDRIFEGDIVTGCSALDWHVGDIVVAETPEGFLVKRLGKGCLLPNSSNPIHKPIYFKDHEEVRIVSVVTGGVWKTNRRWSSK